MATPVPSKTPVSPPTPAPRFSVAAPPKPIAVAAASRLSGIKRERLKLGLRYMFYGPEGVGKTTLANDAGALTLDIEGGSGEIEAQRYPFNPGELDEFVPRNYEQVLAAVDDLIAHPKHGFGAVSLDTSDALEAKIHRYLCEQNKVKNLESIGGGFGKGYRAAVEELRRFLAKLDTLRAQGVSIIFIGHSAVVPFKNPEGEDFDRYQLHAHKDFGGQLKEWCDVVGFIHFEQGAKKIEGDESRSKRARGWTTNRRLIQLARAAAWDAKNRLSMPDEIELDATHPWQPFAVAMMNARNASAESLAAAVLVELDRIGLAEFTTAAGKTTSRQAMRDLAAKSDSTTLSRIVAGLQATPTPVSQES